MELFQNPLYLGGATLWVAGAWALNAYADKRRFQLLSLLGRPATLLRLVPAETGGRRRIQWALQTTGVAFLFIALAGPQWGVELTATRSQEIQVLLAVDTSLSMLAEDAKPSRIEKAKREMAEMIEGLKGERVGILTFAGAAHVQCPLTTDIEAARSFLGSIRVGMVPQAGTAIADTLELGTKILSKYPGHKAIVLLTDGEDRRRDPMEPAREATQAGIHLYIVGVGTPEGEPIPLKDEQGKTTGYLKDRGGKTVVSKLQEEASIRLAAAAQGAYYRATPEETEAREVLRHIRGLERSSARAGSTRRYKNRYAIPLLLGFFLLLLEMFVPERGNWKPALPQWRRRATAPTAPGGGYAPGTAGKEVHPLPAAPPEPKDARPKIPTPS